LTSKITSEERDFSRSAADARRRPVELFGFGASGNAFAPLRRVTARRHARAAHQYRAAATFRGKVPATLLTVGLLILCSVNACQRGVPAIDTAPKAVQGDGTIAGTVRGGEGTSPVDGRTVEVINVDTGQRHRVSTTTTGSFSFKLHPGTYRVQLTLRDGESLVRQPGLIQLNTSDVESTADFVVGTVRVSRPRGPAYRTDDGLGSPIA
jgi:carboxypeptidase family protein